MNMSIEISIPSSRNSENSARKLEFDFQQKKVLVEMINMGIPKINSLFLMKFYKCGTINNAMLFETCLLCNDYRKRHREDYNNTDYLKANIIYQTILQIFNNEEEQAKLMHSIYRPQNFEECTICYMQIPDEEFLIISGISHKVCLHCLKEYLNNEIINGNVLSIKCPHCQYELNQKIIKENTNQIIFNKYITFLNNKRINADPMSRWCPNPNCGQTIQLKKKSDKIATCRHCIIFLYYLGNLEICTLCNKQIHKGQSCESVFDQELKHWSDQKDAQRCPKCHIMVEKFSGCNHMTCEFCKYEWCWLCGASYTNIHFLPFNPLGCPGLMSGNYRAGNWNIFKRFLWRLFIFIGLILIFPFVLIFAGPVALTAYIYENHWRNMRYENKCIQLLALMGIFFIGFLLFLIFLGILLDPIFISLILIAIVPFLIFVLYEYYKQRNQMENRNLIVKN